MKLLSVQINISLISEYKRAIFLAQLFMQVITADRAMIMGHPVLYLNNFGNSLTMKKGTATRRPMPSMNSSLTRSTM